MQTNIEWSYTPSGVCEVTIRTLEACGLDSSGVWRVGQRPWIGFLGCHGIVEAASPVQEGTQVLMVNLPDQHKWTVVIWNLWGQCIESVYKNTQDNKWCQYTMASSSYSYAVDFYNDVMFDREYVLQGHMLADKVTVCSSYSQIDEMEAADRAEALYPRYIEKASPSLFDWFRSGVADFIRSTK